MTTPTSDQELALDDTRFRLCTHCKAILPIDHPDCCDPRPPKGARLALRMGWIKDDDLYLVARQELE
jgi:hypothetical protein